MDINSKQKQKNWWYQKANKVNVTLNIILILNTYTGWLWALTNMVHCPLLAFCSVFAFYQLFFGSFALVLHKCTQVCVCVFVSMAMAVCKFIAHKLSDSISLLALVLKPFMFSTFIVRFLNSKVFGIYFNFTRW